MKVKRTEQFRIKKSSSFYPVIDELCLKAKNLYNYGNYVIRDEFITTTKQKEQGLMENAHWIRYNELYHLCKTSDPYKDLGASAAQGVLRKLDQNWKSFFASMKEYKKNPDKFLGRPKLPKYLPKKEGRYELDITNQMFCIKNNKIWFQWGKLKALNEYFATNISPESKLCMARFVPGAKEYTLEVVYEMDVPDTETVIPQRVAGVSFGTNNLITVVTNCRVTPFSVNGRPIQSINRYYDKTISQKQSDLKQRNRKDWSNEMRRFTTKRNNKVKDYIHKTSKMLIDFCRENQIDTIVCNYQPLQKQNLPKSRTFQVMPHQILLEKIQYKCEDAGILMKTIASKSDEFPDDINKDVFAGYQAIEKLELQPMDELIANGKHPKILNVL